MNAATADGGVRLLADGNRVPVLGLGVWQVPDGRECVDAVRWALDTGYRHIDTSQAYGNEESVGRALRDSGVPRDQVFITTKFHPRRNDPVAQAEKSLRRLGVEQIDLYLVHRPEGGATRAWAGLERARELGLARSIGVSDISAAELYAVIDAGTILPAVNQVQFNPRHSRRALLAGVRPAQRCRRGLQPARHRPVCRRCHGGQDRPADGPDASAGAAALVPAARTHGHRQVNAPRHFAAGHRRGTTGRTTQCP
ncbi:MAG: aldo/keto reductase [Streptosporangiaceae bacterium]